MNETNLKVLKFVSDIKDDHVYKDIALKLAAINPTMFLALAKDLSSLEQEMLELLRDGNRWIAAIKLYRERTGADLKESKAVIDKLRLLIKE